MEYFVCPNRTRQFDIKDFYNDGGSCTFCGSITPDKFIEFVMLGKEIYLDKSIKMFYIDSMLFNLKHCDDDQLNNIKNFYETGLINVKDISFRDRK